MIKQILLIIAFILSPISVFSQDIESDSLYKEIILSIEYKHSSFNSLRISKYECPNLSHGYRYTYTHPYEEIQHRAIIYLNNTTKKLEKLYYDTKLTKHEIFYVNCILNENYAKSLIRTKYDQFIIKDILNLE